ncbi:inverse autotransporter beta-barrel domain-containing protein [Yersinia enterocolitica]|uniref:inverse autotransporter beta-barrel domain-containing protein n=1 Tax=Yersinia enterocolitica TaxID=630 RepID=UPI00065A90EB|nr:inverse autotransporter beta-barrel domain-containing protein [Yersinia enterocolitica]CRY22320.1 putative adhesin [Yersinia enterocolitica]
MGSIFKGIERYLCAGFMKKAIAYTQIILQILLGTLPLYSMSFSTQANSDITKKTVLFKQLHTLTPTDTLESVAASYGLSVDELWALNINLYNNRSAFDAVKYGAVVYVPNQEEEQRATQQASLVASHLSQVGNSLSSENRVDAFSRLAKGMLLSSTAKTVEEWLGHIGQAQVKLQTDDKNDFSGSEIDLFIPLYDQPDKLAFSQFGFRRIDQRNIMNIGLGQRHYVSDWMFGYNIFFDQQISGNAHRRVGFGGELARDYLKLSANSYHRLGGWKNSARLEDYDERAANGYDIRTEAYLPHYPQLGGKLMYEQYFGDEVALFGINERQKNPSALTAGVSYTPIPLVSLGLDHTIGNGGKKKTGVNVAVNYEINTPWPQQIDPAAVQATRTLAGSRMDLVDRNNNIVLEYRKQQVVTLNLPEKVSGKEKQVVPINYTFNARHGLDRIEWDAADVIKAGGQVSNVGNLAYHVAMPPYIDGAANAYVLSGRAIDKKGNYSTSSSTNIYVTGVNINRINSTISLNPATLPANGTSRSIIQLKLNTDAGQAVSGASGQMTFAIRDSSGRVFKARTLLQPLVIDDVQEVQSGVYEASITSGFLTGRFEITPTVRGVQLNPIILTQSADKTTATITDSSAVTISTPSITTNATDKTKLEVLVTDALGHPVPGVEVKWVSDLKSSSLEHATSITNEHGIAENNFSSTVTGTANITVQVGTEAPVQAGAIEIKADNSTMTVKANDFTVAATPVVADGTSKAVYKLKVTDKQGNVVPGAAVEWSSNIGSFVQGSSTTTDTNGETFIELVSTKAETAKVTATVGGKPYNAGKVVFVADRQSGKITLLPVSKNSAAANGIDSITLNAKILDANGNPIKNEEIEWDAASHKVTFSPATGKTQTNDLGETQITLTSTDVGDITLNAQVVKNNLLVNQASEKLSFTADTVTANISAWSAPSVKTLIADGQSQVIYKVVVKDKNGHVVANSPVLWETNLGEFVPAQPTTTMTSTNSQGEATVVLASIKAGFATVKASVNGNKNTSPTQVEFTANRSTAKITLAPMTQRDFVANDKDKVTYSVTVVDANNNPVKAEAISWKAENGHPVKIEPASSQTDEQGKATVNIGSVKAGKTQIRATLGNAATAIADAITFEADRQTAEIKTVEVKGNNQPAPDGSSSVSYVTTVADANGNPVGGMTLSWGSNINKVASQTTTTDINGQSSQTITGTQVGKVKVSVALTEGDNAKIQKENIGEAEFVAVTPVASNAELLLQPNVIISDGKQTATLRFTLRDANHNPVSGLASQINITQSVADRVKVGTISETTAKGVYQATITGMKEGAVDLTATVKGSNVSKIQRLTLQADNKTATLKSVTSDIKKAAADGTARITYTASVVDAQGNASLANVSVGWKSNLGELVAMTKTNASGEATVALTSKQAGSATVTAIVSSSSEMKAASVTFTAGGIAIAQSTASVSAIDLVADGVTTTKLTVKVNDANGNPLTGQSGKIKVTAANFPGLTTPTSFVEGPDGVYTATISGTTAGEGEIVTTLDGKELAKQKLKVIADVRSAKIAVVKPLQAGSVAVGDKVTYQATLKDANDNLLGAGIPVHWSVNRDTLMSGKLISLTNSAGVAEVEISRDLAGDAVVTAAVGNNSLQATAVKFTSGGVDISKSSMQLLQGNITADNLDIATIQVDIRDSKGNPLSNLASQITTSPKNGEHGLKIETIDNPSGDGYLVNIKGTKAGNHTVTVSVAGNPLPTKVDMVLKGDATTAKIESVKSSSITFKADNVDTVTYTAKVVDANNNLLENIAVSWRLAQGGGQYQSQSYTGKTGIAETKLSASILGTYKMEAQVRQQVKAAADVNSTAGDADPSQSDFVVDVASIDASGKTKATLTATLKDKFGNLLVGQQVKLTDSNNLKGIKFTANPMKDNGDGTYSTEVSATAKGNTQIIASINGVNLTQQPQLLVGNIIPQLSFAKNKHAITYSRKASNAQVLTGLPAGVIAHWSSDNSDVANVDATSGEIKVLKAGVVNISAVTLANATYAMGTASYQLTVDKADPQINFPVTKRDYKWMDSVSPQNFVLSNSDVTMSELKTFWQSDDNRIATVDTQGRVALVKPGKTKIIVISEENERFKRSEASYELSVAKYKQPISFAKGLLSNKDSDSVNVQQPNEKLSTYARLETKWSSSDSSIIKVANDGSTAMLTGPGKARITLKVVGNDWYEEQTGSYEHEVYAKPIITITKTTATSNHVGKDNESEWSPVFTDDKFKVMLKNSGSDYQKANSVTVTLQHGNKELVSESMTIHSDTYAEFKPQPDWVGKSLKVKVVARNAVGQESKDFLSNEIKVEKNKFKPHEIWDSAVFTRNYKLHESSGKVTEKCNVLAGLTTDNSWLYWIIEIRTASELLHPLNVKLLQSKPDGDGFNIDHFSNWLVSSTNIKNGDDLIDDTCSRGDSAEYTTTMNIEYMGNTYKYKTFKHLYWEGGGQNMGNDQSDGFTAN